MYEIIKAPIPSKPVTTKGHSKYPFAKLEVGESFLVPNKDLNPPAHLLELSSTYGNMKTHVSRHNNKILPDRRFQCSLSGNYIQVSRLE
jgi:hypothetical protein